MRRRFVVVLSLVSSVALAQLSPEEVATIQREQAKARDAVVEKYKGKDKLSAAELRAQSKELAAAERGVLDAHNVKAGDWVKASAKMSNDDRAKVDAVKKQLTADEEAAAKKADAKKEVKPGEVIIETDGKNEAAEMDKAMGFGKRKR